MILIARVTEYERYNSDALEFTVVQDWPNEHEFDVVILGPDVTPELESVISHIPTTLVFSDLAAAYTAQNDSVTIYAKSARLA